MEIGINNNSFCGRWFTCFEGFVIKITYILMGMKNHMVHKCLSVFIIEITEDEMR